MVNEGTEYRNEGSPIVQSCELIDGAKEMLLTLKERGYTIELVADGYTQSFDNSYGQHGLKNIFDARTISEEVGEKKPSQAMFEAAMKLLHLTAEDKKRIIMVGNNLERDIVGANRFGITSVFIKWSPRYPMEPKNEEEVPVYHPQTIGTAGSGGKTGGRIRKNGGYSWRRSSFYTKMYIMI